MWGPVGVVCGGRMEPAARPPMLAGGWVLLTPSHPGHTRHLTNSAALRRMGLVPRPPPVPGLLAALPAAHREVRHSVVVRLEHPGVLENVVSKCVEPVQRDQDLSAGDPLLGKGTGTHQQVLLACSTGKSCSLVPGSGGGPGAQGQARLRQILRGGQESGGLGQSWGCTALVRSPNALVPLSPSVKCRRLEAP